MLRVFPLAALLSVCPLLSGPSAFGAPVEGLTFEVYDVDTQTHFRTYDIWDRNAGLARFAALRASSVCFRRLTDLMRDWVASDVVQGARRDALTDTRIYGASFGMTMWNSTLKAPIPGCPYNVVAIDIYANASMSRSIWIDPAAPQIDLDVLVSKLRAAVAARIPVEEDIAARKAAWDMTRSGYAQQDEWFDDLTRWPN